MFLSELSRIFVRCPVREHFAFLHTFVLIKRRSILSPIRGFHAISGDTNNNGEMNKCRWKSKRAMSDLLFTVHQHGGDDVT